MIDMKPIPPNVPMFQILSAYVLSVDCNVSDRRITNRLHTGWQGNADWRRP